MTTPRPWTARLAGAFLVLAGLGGCAVGPAGRPAPVEDRTAVARPLPAPPPRPTVEVRPLPPEEPIRTAPGAEPGRFQERPLPAPEPGMVPSETPPAEPRPALAAQDRPANPAVLALIDNAGRYVGAGELEKAAAAYERALRIDPHNAGIWHDLAVIRFQQRHYQQAEALAAKSNGLAARADSGLRAQNWRLIAQARRATGDQAGADAADAQAVTLERPAP
jgi:hypothetical protein